MKKGAMIPKRINVRSRTFITLYYWGKFLGINPLYLSPNDELTFSYTSILYSCFLCSIYCYSYYRVCNERLNIQLPDETPVSVIAGWAELINVGLNISLTWLINGFFQNRLKLIVQSFVKVEKTSRKLNIPENYEIHFKNLGRYLLFVNGGWFLLIIVNVIGLSDFSDYKASLWTSYNVFRIPSYNSVTTFLWSILVIKRKFYRLNEKVRFLVFQRHEKSSVLGNSRHNPGVLSDMIDNISQHHRDLIEVIHVVKRHFDLLVFLCIMAHMPICVVNVYLAYKTMKEDKPMAVRNWFYTFSYMCWFSFPIIILLVISNVCGSTTNEANETGNILHAMLNNCGNFGDTREIAKFDIFSLELLQNPLKMSLFGFVDLDHWMVYKILTTAITYLVIMLQFYN